MTHGEIREKFLKFFEDRGHKIAPSSSLLPTDPSVLFTTAGMQQFKPYFMGTADPVKDFGAKRVASIQKSMRTSDIDEVGDKSHFTFFEMLGHFSFGDYFKKETIQWTYEFLTEELKIDKERISATVFAGNPSTDSTSSQQANSGQTIPFDSESYNAWAELIPADRIQKGPKEDNIWGPAGPEGPCGAANEVYVDGLEVATLVFMEYYCDKNQNLTPLPQKGVDVGWGFERIVQIVQGKDSVFEIDLLEPVIKLVPTEFDDRARRIITDHSRAIAFLITDEVRPSNKEHGYVLRRLMRRIITYFYISKADSTVMHDIFARIVETYGHIYPELNANLIIHEFDKEKEKFEKTLEKGLKILSKEMRAQRIEPGRPFEAVDLSPVDGFPGSTPLNLTGEWLFNFYQSFGFPPELSIEIIKGKFSRRFTESEIKELLQSFKEELERHQEKSRAGAEKKFGGHGLLLDTGELKAGNEEELKKATRLHTATHLLHASLRKVLGEEVKQAGSDITAERLRFDFTFPRKLTAEEIEQVEDMVNEAVQKDYPVIKEEMSYEDAIKSGAMAFFKLKYPPIVNVFTIGPDTNNSPSTDSGQFFSKELCGGPHVSHTVEIGKFKITKEEAVSAGVRRIRAVVE